MKSIIQDEKECYVCGTRHGLQKHHIFGGTANRKKSEQYGLTVWLCMDHHTGDHGVHRDQVMMDCFHMKGQLAFEERIGGREIFRKEFGKSYL